MILSLMTCKIWGAKIEHGVLWFGNLEKLGFFYDNGTETSDQCVL